MTFDHALQICLIHSTGHGEYFVWADVENDAVLFISKLEQLVRELDYDEECRELLDFRAFETGLATNAIAAVLREKNTLLNSLTARALGKTAKAFGMTQVNVTLDHLRDFVARMMDGWTIVKGDRLDMHTFSSIAFTFATSLGAHAAGYNVQDIMGAFLDGVDEGTRCIARWSRSGSGSRRQRFRTA